MSSETERLEKELEEVTDLIDDILYDPWFRPNDEDGKPINGDKLYLLAHPVMEDHMPALREWFVRRIRTTAEAAKESP